MPTFAGWTIGWRAVRETFPVRVEIALKTHIPMDGENMTQDTVRTVSPAMATPSALAVQTHPRAHVLPVPRENTAILEYALTVRTVELVII